MAFMRLKNTGFTAVLPTLDNPRNLLFYRRGATVAQVSQTALVSDGPLSSAYGTKLAGIPEPFAGSCDGALHIIPGDSNYDLVLFNGDNCLRWRAGVGQVYNGAVSGLAGFGTRLPAGYTSDVDCLISQPWNDSWQSILFKGNRCAVLNWSYGVSYEGPVNGLSEAGWKKLPDEFLGDFDHAVMLDMDGSTPRTLFIKGDRGMIFHWANGPEKTGKLVESNAGLGALPAAYKTLFKPATGRYTGASGTTSVELRVDVDGPFTQRMVSGDLFTVAGGTTTYANSFIVDTPTITATNESVTVTGTARNANNATTQPATVVLSRTQPGTATLTLGAAGAQVQFACNLASPYLRTVDMETDTMTGTRAFGSYNTANAPRPYGMRARVMTVADAYADMGIELRNINQSNEVPVASAGADLRWSSAELHAAMVANFSEQRDVPQWKLWTFVATRYVDDGILGIMFDQQGSQRQGMAVLWKELENYGLLGGRGEFHTHVHELGHAFNLLHSWQKNIAQPPQPLGPSNGYGDLSWMNYDWKYQSPQGNGQEPFWAAFPLRFTDSELKHLRHGFYRNVVPGGSDFIINSMMTALEDFSPPLTDESGLRLILTGKSEFVYGEPVVAEFKLALDGTRASVEVAPSLDPQGENLAIAITDPSGATRPWRPMIRKCEGHDRRVTLDAANPALYASSYLGYGADGLTFEQPGTYRIRAVYSSPDGARVVSPEQVIRVRPPFERADAAVGELLMGDQQGTLLTVLGSDAPQLQQGNDALDELLAVHADHPLAVYARMVKGTNAGRHFLTLSDGEVSVRRADTKESINQLNAVVDASTGVGSAATAIDNISLNETMQRLARAHAREGDFVQADAVLEQLVETFEDKNVPPAVLETIQNQADAAREAIREENS
ncbi:hypothetical protein [Embleya sp. NPDC005575]|uniref:tetratricopeptide repeat protein n=1 Tax=Embleya sp. NPDC005575 TaxID=3156892 RepID=UPI0033A6C73F